MWKRHLPAGWIVAGLTLVLVFAPGTVHASEITNELKSTIDEVIHIVTDNALKKNHDERRKKLRDAISKRFNYKQMVMRSLAKNWNKRTPKEQKDFIALFKKLLEHSYASKIETYSDEKINYVDEVVKGKYALVKTEIVRRDGTIGVDYKLVKDDGEWRVYDFVIEGVSMIRNYRSQFNKIIHKESYEALVKKLSSKIDELEKPEGNSQSENL
ncbi:MAG: phospholipid-binding protein MlaC [Nitrospinaceae bacterium]